MNTDKIIYALLSADATLLTLLGASTSTVGLNKIYPGVAPQKESAPFVVYTEVSEAPDHCAQGTAVRTGYVQVDCWALTPDSADAIAERVITTLNGQSGTIATYNVDNILLENKQGKFEPDLDPPLYGRQVEFQIRVAI